MWALKSQHNVVQQSVFTRDYNYRNAPEEMSQSADVTSGDVTTYGEAYHWADNYQAPGSDGTSATRSRRAGRFMPVCATSAT